jgi:cytochrome c biogenesis factor
MARERQVLLKCDRCGAAHMTKDIGAEQLVGLSPEAIDTYVTKIKSPFFAKLMIILMGMALLVPIVGLVIYVRLRRYRQYIRGNWRKAYLLFLFLTVLSNALWVPYIVHVMMKEGL